MSADGAVPADAAPPAAGAAAAGFSRLRAAVLLVVAGCAATAAYSGHFGNGFRYDDWHTLVENPWIARLDAWPKFFERGAETFSVLPTNRSYRPLTTLSFAIDVERAGGRDPRAFHATTFAFFLLEALFVYALARRAWRAARPESDGRLFGVAVAALRLFHAANAETLNYHIARSDVLSTCAVLGGLTLYASLAGRPGASARRVATASLLAGCVGALGVLAKESAAVLPALVGLWALCVERRGLVRSVLAVLPALVVAGGVFAWSRTMQGGDMVWGGVDRTTYLLTQAHVVLGYAGAFFAPFDLAVEHENAWIADPRDPRVLLGAAFLAAATVLFYVALRRPRGGPFAFGLGWFFVALLPTSSVVPLYEARNDHRLYFPFVGACVALVAALFAAGGRAVAWATLAGEARKAKTACAVLFCGLLAAHAVGVRTRSEVWSSDVALWEDATRKSPGAGRAWMNAGLAHFEAGRTETALAFYRKAKELLPKYVYADINLGLAEDRLGRYAEADRRFAEAAEREPRNWQVPLWNGRRLLRRGLAFEAAAQFGLAVRLQPRDLAARRAWCAALDKAGLPAELVRAARDALGKFPGDAEILGRLDALPPKVRVAAELAAAAEPPSAAAYAELSSALFFAKNYAAATAAAKTATELDPTHVGAWNNLGAAYGGLERYADEIAACREALRLEPTNALAKANLAWAESRLGAASRRAESAPAK